MSALKNTLYLTRKDATKSLEVFCFNNGETLFQSENGSNGGAAVRRCKNSHEVLQQKVRQAAVYRARVEKQKLAAALSAEAQGDAETHEEVPADLSMLLSYVTSEDAAGASAPAPSVVDPNLSHFSAAALEMTIAVAAATTGTLEGFTYASVDNPQDIEAPPAPSHVEPQPLPELNCRRYIKIYKVGSGEHKGRWKVDEESLESSHHPDCISQGRVTGAVIQEQCGETISGTEKSAKKTVQQMMSTARLAGCAAASISTVHKAFNGPRVILEARAEDDWDSVFSITREYCRLNSGSTIGIKTMSPSGDTIVRLIRSDSNGTLIEESPVRYTPYPSSQLESGTWEAPQFSSLFLRML